MGRFEERVGQAGAGALFLAMVVGGCAAAPDRDGDAAAVAEVREAYVEATKTGDVEALLGVYTDDAVVMPPGRPAITGKAALRDHERAHHEAFAHPALSLDSAELVVAGEWAFDRGVESMTEAPRDGSAPIDVEANYLTVYRRQPDGGWRIARSIFNSSQSAGGSPFLLAQPCITPAP